MRLSASAARALAAAAFVFIAAPAAAEPGFSHAGIAKDAERYESYLKDTWKQAKGRPADLKLAAEKLAASDPRAAARRYAEAVAVDPKDAPAWIGLARALLAVKPETTNTSERYDLPINASGAAYRAAERARDSATRAEALRVLADALQRRSYWRPAIDALKASLTLVDNTEARQAFDRLRAEHGFRMTDYKTEADASEPRICAQFSERLAGGSADLAKFVALDGRDPQAVFAEGKQLCLEGLKHGTRYEITLRAGLPSDTGEQLQKPVTIAAYMPDRKPFVRFSGRNYVLPSRGQQGIPVVAVNTARAAVEVYRIGDRNLATALQNGDLQRQLSGHEIETIRDRTGNLVYKGELELPVKLNEETTTAFPVTEAIGALKPGAYAMTARAAERTGASEHEDALATQWFVVSDLGLTAFSGTDGVHGFVRSLADATPVAGAAVRLIARNNEILGETKSDTAGYVRFAAGLGRGEGGLQPAILVAENAGGEFAFLDLSAAAFDLSDRGVKGRDASGALDAYLYTERGVYRPDESVNVTALLRDAAGKAATLPTTLVVTRPDGVEHRRVGLPDQGLGGRAERFTLGDGAMTGTWRAKLYTDPKADPVAHVAFLVEDFVPERVELKLDVPQGASLAPDKPQAIKATGRYLYGPPAADLAIEADIVVKAAKEVEGYAGYKFGPADETVSPVRKTLDGLPRTASDGRAEIPVTLPALQKTAKPLVAELLVRLRESGGRTIERTVSMPVAIAEPRIGIKPAFGADGLEADANAAFSVVLLDAAGKPAAGELTWELKRLETNWQWYSRDGHWTYEAVTLSRKAASGKLSATADAPARIEAKTGYGRYKLEVASPASDGPVSSVLFNAGWFANAEDADSPETLDVALDKQSYKPGDTAKLRIATKQGGKALVAVLGSGLHAMQEVDIAKGGGEVSIPVGEWGAGAYATALLYRPMDEKAKRMPGRALGIKWLPLDQSSRTLKLALDIPAKVKSGASVKLPVKITGLAAGEEARVTIAAVDQGVLNLTRYEMPAPDRHFYAQRRLGLEIRDFYGRLIDGMRAERGKLRSGGDGPAGMSMTGSPPVEELVSYYSGILKVAADGTASTELQLPDFNGQVRVMAVAWSADKLGHAGADLIVRDAVTLTASAPRFLTLGDEARLDVAIHNVEGAPGSYPVILEYQSGDKIERALDLKSGERKSERFVLKPGDVGLKEYVARVTGPGGIEVKRKLTFEVVPPAGDIKRTTVSSIAAKGGRITLSADLLPDLIPSRTRVNVSVGPAALLDVPGLLTQLDRYPYGCAEQTVSRALPLLYANTVAAAIGIGPDKELKARIEGAIARVLEMQDASGAFGIWGPSDGDMWLTAYVTDFLTRARELGYAVPQKAFTQALDKLHNHVSMANDVKQTGAEGRAYATYVLARNSRAPAGELRYYADTRLDAFATPLAKAQLGAALAMHGDKERAERLFRAALAQFDGNEKDAIARSDYGSRLRDGAALVTLATETGYVKGEAPRLVNVVAKAAQARTYTSTQEQAWLLLAAKALSDQAANTTLSVNGKRVTGSLVRAVTAAELKAGPVSIVNEGDEAVDAVVSVVGAALTPEPAVSKGLKIERSYYTLDGKKVELKSAAGGTAELKQNDRLVTVLKIEAAETGGRLLLVDHLAAGLEIENPRLVDGGDIKTLDWLKPTVRPEHTEFRDDRFVAAFNFFGPNTRRAEGRTVENDGDGDDADSDAPAAPSAKQVTGPVNTATVAYIVRAVTPGSFVHGAATVEDMYRPERHARTPSGRLMVKE